MALPAASSTIAQSRLPTASTSAAAEREESFIDYRLEDTAASSFTKVLH